MKTVTLTKEEIEVILTTFSMSGDDLEGHTNLSNSVVADCLQSIKIKLSDRHTVGQLLKKRFEAEEAIQPGNTPLRHYLEYNYKERYCKMCYRLGLHPATLGEWLATPVNSIW